MKILLTNDDGPPHPQISPYIASFACTLTHHGHTVDVVIPSQQRSWIGKAHLLPASHGITPAASTAEKSGDNVERSGGDNVQGLNKNEDVSDLLTVRYWIPAQDGESGEGTVQEHRPENGTKYWILVPSTPAACTQLGLFHHTVLFPSSSSSSTSSPAPTDSDYDLVLSGPNLGRNTSSTFALSSGTLGGALEAALCRRKAIALSFAHYTRTESKEIINEACEMSVRIIEKLVEGWDGLGGGSDVPDLYSINVPLVEGVSKQEVHWTWMLNNRSSDLSLYKHIPTSSSVISAQESATSPSTSATTSSVPTTSPNSAATTSSISTKAAPSFKWAPSFTDLWKTIAESPAGNDALVVGDKGVSVTALKACYLDVYGRGGFEGVLKL